MRCSVNVVPRILMTAGFCTGTVGAIGFGKEVPGLAWGLFLGGLGIVVAVGFVE